MFKRFIAAPIALFFGNLDKDFTIDRKTKERRAYLSISRPQTNGARETSRRVRQIEAGQLTKCNGLVS